MLKYQASTCASCSSKDECCKKAKNRFIQVMPQDKLMQRIKVKLKTPIGKEVSTIRSQTVERSFGDLKHNKKFRHFFLRGIKKVRIEFDLVCIAHNLVRISNIMKKKAKVSAVHLSICWLFGVKNKIFVDFANC